jgi:hypothetical protein
MKKTHKHLVKPNIPAKGKMSTGHAETHSGHEPMLKDNKGVGNSPLPKKKGRTPKH